MKNLLFIEDDAAQRELTTRLYQMCRQCFHGEVEFLTANSWEAGMKIVRRVSIDVVIADLTLPPMNKEETLKEIESTSNLPPVIILTGNETDPDLRRKCFLAGCDDFMLKSAVNHHPESLCERVYHSYLRRLRRV